MCFTSEVKSLSVDVYVQIHPCNCSQPWLLLPTRFLCKPKVSPSPETVITMPIPRLTKFEYLTDAYIRPRRVIFQHSWPQGHTVLVSELNMDRQRSQGLCSCQGRAGSQVQVPSSGPLSLPSLPNLQLLPLHVLNTEASCSMSLTRLLPCH